MGIGTIILYIVGILCAVWVVYDVFTNQRKMTTGLKVMWTVLAIIFSIITAIIYYFVVYNKK